MPNRKISWDKAALLQFGRAIDYIAKDSIQNAEKVRAEILEKIGNLSDHPETNALDKYKIDNDGHYRAFELHHLRIAYYVGQDEIRILRLRSTYQEPLPY